MPVYKYTAVNQKGKEEKGIIEATSLSHLRDILSSKNLIPVFVEEVDVSVKKGVLNRLIAKLYSQKVSQDELALLLYQLGILLEKNVHITEAISIVAESQENSFIKDALLKSKSLITEGKKIAEAFKTTNIFPDFLIEMIKAGEESGALGSIFISSSEFIERQNQFKSQVVNSLIYPSIVIGVGFVSLFIIMQVVVPTITKIYAQFKMEVPTSTKIVIALSELTGFFIKTLPFIGILFFVFRKKLFREEYVETVKMKIPFFKKVYLYSEISNFSSTMHLLLQGGLTLTQALEIAASSLRSKHIKSIILEGKEKVEKGFRLSQFLKGKELIPSEVVQMIALGEESGRLEEMFKLLSVLYRKHTEKLISKFLTLLEPITLIILSVMIGFFIFATLFPIFNLSIK